MNKNDGGTAFPDLTNDYVEGNGNFVSGQSGGVTLRDWFAGQAIAAGWFAYKPEEFAGLGLAAQGVAGAMIVERDR